MSAVTTLVLITGCTTIAKPVQSTAGIDRAYQETIALDGRLSVRYQQNGKDEGLHGGFGWRQMPGRTAIELRSPVGQTVAAIEVTPSESTLTQAGQPPRRAANIDSLTADTLGWPLPVSGMRDWLQGFGVDADGRRFVASPNGPQTIRSKDGWIISYDSWQPVSGTTGVFRPRRVDLARDTDQAGPVALRIVIDTWQTP